MDRRALLALALSLLVIVAWTVIFAPRTPPPSAPPPGESKKPVGSQGGASAGQEGPSNSLGQTEGAPSPTGEAAAEVSPPAPKREAVQGAPNTVVETDLARVEFANPGGRIISWTLTRYQDRGGRAHELVAAEAASLTNAYPFHFRFEDKGLKGIEDLLNTKAGFDVERRPVHTGATDVSRSVPDPSPSEPRAEGGDRAGASATPGAASHDRSSGGPATPATVTSADTGTRADEGEEIRLIYSDGQGLQAIKTFVFRKGSYLVAFSASVTRNGAPLAGRVVWGPGLGMPSPEDLANRYYHADSAVADYGQGPTRLRPDKVPTPRRLDEGLRWAGLEDQYFAAVLIPADGLAGTEIVPTIIPPPPASVSSPSSSAKSPGKNADKPITRLSVAVPIGQNYTLFAGPKDFQLLSGLGNGLSDLVNFTPSIPLIGPLVGMLAKILYGVLRWIHSFLPNYGLAIIILTAAIKIAFYPITQRTMVKMRAVQQQMQKVQPKIKAIREKYRKAKDASVKAKMNEEIMALYKREGINPMASLGGCLPLLIQLPILYGFYSVLTVSIELRQAPFFGWIQDLSRSDPYYITPIVMGVSMFVQQKMAMTAVSDPQQRAQQRMMLVMPLIFTYTFLALPSGLVLYWFVNNVLGIVQQVLINRQARALETEGAAATGKA